MGLIINAIEKKYDISARRAKGKKPTRPSFNL